MVQDNIIIFVDVTGSSAYKVKYGDDIANDHIAERLLNVQERLASVDPTLQRRSPAEGDSILLTGSDPRALFVEAMRIQQDWHSFEWKHMLPVRIAIGAGNYEVMPDGEWEVLRGAAVDFTKRLTDLPPDVVPLGKIVVTESARAHIQAEALGFKLLRRQYDIPGFGDEVFYVTNGVHHDEPTHKFATPAQAFFLGALFALLLFMTFLVIAN